jgi:uncharacterized protein YcfL
MSMKHLVLNLVVLVGVLAFATGCRTAKPIDPAAPPAVDTSRVVTDAVLAKKVQVVQILQTHTDGGLLQVQVELLNRSRRGEEINYRFEWVDRGGFAIDTILSRWGRLSLVVGQPVMIQGLAPTPNATDFRLKLVRDY